MSSIHRTKHGTYEVKWREGEKQRSKSRKSRAEAVALQAEVDRRSAEGKPILSVKEVPTLASFTQDWVTARSDLEESTQIRYAEQLQTHVLPLLGHLPLTLLRPKLLADWQRQRLEEGAGPAVLGKAQALLSQILDTAVLPHEYLDVNPVLALKRPAYKKKAHRWLTAAEVEALRSWYLERDDLGSATLLSILGYVGIRPQDALARIWPDLDGKLLVETKVTGGEVKPGSKTDEDHKRRVYVPAPVLDDLEEWRLATSGSGLMFPRSKDGLPWTKTDYDNWASRAPKGKKKRRPRCFKKAAEEVGLGPALTPYDLRHTAATLFAASGWNHVQIANQLGHSPNVSANVYQHLLDGDTSPSERRSIEDYIREARGIAPESVRNPLGVEAR
jgi:integrase